jgi:hypothetical protein
VKMIWHNNIANYEMPHTFKEVKPLIHSKVTLGNFE